MTRRANWRALALVAGLGISGSVQATVLFEQVASSSSTTFYISSPLDGAGNSPGTRRADDFQLSQDAVVRDLHWWGVKSSLHHTEGGYTLEDSYNFTFTIYTDDSGKPGAIYHVTTGSLSYVDGTLADVTWDRYFTSDLASPFSVQAGVTYWLSIYSDLAGHSWAWQPVVASTGTHVYRSTTDSAAWVSNTLDLAFRVTGDFATVPEPATLALFGIGLAGLGAFRRKLS